MACRRLSLATLLSLLACLFGLSPLPAAEVASPLEPAEAQRLFQLPDASLRIELAAAEPDVVDPVAIRFDEDGRMWVVELRDYPLGPPGGGAGLSCIRVLEDRDGDGRYETATTFADKLSFVTGLQPWQGGVFVTLAGSVVYMKDTDGDGRSDLDETWFDGFAEQNSQLRANHPRLALDNHIYIANGLRGGKVVNRKLPGGGAIDISGMDFRFDPLTGRAEAVSGNGQFGLCFDDWGNRFNCSNRNPCRHVVLEDRYLRATPSVTVPAVMHDVAAFGEASRIFAISRAWTTSNLHAGQFTAACGVTIYRGDLLPAEFRGNVFTCDPTGNLIHREIMQPAGPTFTSKPAYEGKEFLASPDEWFRPVNMELGPDGALYVVDMYRCVIEHPDFVPDELKQRPDQRLGDDRGRIWRIVPADTNPTRQRGTTDSNPTRERGTKLGFSTAKSDELVPLLEHPNAWQRETAQRLLLERAWRPTADALTKMAHDSKLPQGRLHAWAVLQALGQFDEAAAGQAINDPDPRVRRCVCVLIDTLGGNAPRQLLMAALHDQDAGVRFQARLSLAASTPDLTSRYSFDRELPALVQADAEDEWQRRAITLFLGSEGCGSLVGKIVTDPKLRLGATPALAQFAGELAEQGAASDSQPARERALSAAGVLELNPSLGLAALHGAMRGLARRRIALADAISPPSLETLRTGLQSLVADEGDKPELRQSAVAVLGYVPEASDVLLPLVARDAQQDLRLAAIAALARQPGTEPWLALLDGFPSDTPAARRAIIDGVLASGERTSLLLDALEAGTIKPAELDPLQAKRLTTSRDPRIKQRADKLIAAATPAERALALAEYQAALALPADARRGQAIFEKNCAACHKVAGIGVNVAPDISDTRTKTAEQLLGDILLPNRAIDNNYIGYSVRLLDGTVTSGILAAETATSFTLRQQGDKQLVIARGEIDELKSTGQSLMPEGFERQIPQQEMADLLSFLKNWRYLDGRTPLAPAGP
ncbi:MAG: PVC-type heme-binding CxxCH protein [Pirellulaceae bacterium]